MLRRRVMQAIQSGYRGISLLFKLNWDWVFSFGTIIVGLMAGAFLGHALTQF